MRKFITYRNYFFKILISLCFFALAYRIIYCSFFWKQILFGTVNFVRGLFGYSIIHTMWASYFTLSTGLASLFVSQIVIDILKQIIFKIKYRKNIKLA
ncbi:hypothetical protein [Clostridium perfringens]|uniref:hypothetical protein n=1 Tax=Clostridium perfringens TaxID=1502 RepID=UPI0024BCD522|nr:hypothetical protein [Clostridium perfringens]